MRAAFLIVLGIILAVFAVGLTSCATLTTTTTVTAPDGTVTVTVTESTAPDGATLEAVTTAALALAPRGLVIREK